VSPKGGPPRQELLRQVQELAGKLQEAEDTLRAIRNGEVDAIIVSGARGEQIFSLTGSDIAYRLIVQTMSEAAITTSMDGRILYCNSQFGKLVGQPMEELVGRPLAELEAPEGGGAIAALIRESGSHPTKRRTVFAGSSGPVPALVSASPLAQPDGPALCVVAADLTELEDSTELIQKLRIQQELLEKSRERFEVLSETASLLLQTRTPHTIITSLCGRVMEILGCDVFLNYLLDKARGTLLLNASAGLPGDAVKAIESLEMGQAKSEVFHDSHVFVGRDIQAGNEPRYEVLRSAGIDTCVCLQLVSQGDFLGSICFGAKSRKSFSTNDIALMATVADQVAIALQRVRMVEALANANESLEARVTKRTEELVQSNVDLERTTRQLRNLAADLALTEERGRRRLAGVLHDHLQQLLVGARQRIESQRPQGREDLKQALDQVDELLGASLEVTHSLTAELSPPVLYASGLGPALEWLAQWMGETQNLEVELSLPFRIPSLAEDLTIQLFQSTRELLFNAVKHARVRQAALTVTVNGGVLGLVVADRGVGFDPDLIVEKTGTESFGLFSIRERLSLIGGRLTIESRPGEGSRFTLSVPLAGFETAGDAGGNAPPMPRGASWVSPAQGIATPPSIRVLLVDDFEITRKGLALLIVRDGDMQVVGEAADGEEAVRLAELLHPDVIVMDVNMPGMNGIEATRLITGRDPSAKVIGLSIFRDTAVESAMREGGAVLYINKSDSPGSLVKAIRSCAGPRHGTSP